ELKGQVYYANKRTFEKIITLKVFPESMREEIEAIKTPSYEKPLTDSSKGFNYSYALIFIIVILVLLIMIKRAKKS
ncbi:MAG: hypothetical protein U9R00_02965, partial [Patescibacteria group bacterium]|nr:hypothetical protein [Patescibacteria group bacterium]